MQSETADTSAPRTKQTQQPTSHGWPVGQLLIRAVRYASWPFALLIGFQLTEGLIPAGLVYLQSNGPQLTEQFGFTFLLVILGLAFLAQNTLQAVNFTIRINLRDKIGASFMREYLTRLATWPNLDLYENPTRVAQKTKAEQAIDRVNEFAFNVLWGLAGIFALIPLLGLAATVNPWFPVILTAGYLPGLWIQERFDKLIWDLEETFAGARQRLEALVNTARAPEFAKDVRTFNMQQWAPEQWRRNQFRLLQLLFRMRTRNTAALAALTSLQAGVAILCCALFIDLARPESIVLVIGVLMTVEQSMWGVMNGIRDILAFRAPARDFGAFMNATPQPAREASGVKEASNAVELHQVTYRYPEAEEVLRGVTASIPRGKVTCIVGPNGAGKSTLIKMLTRLYDPTSGQLHEAPDTRHIAVMNQDFARFPLSVRENLACGDEGLMHDDVSLTIALHRVGLSRLLEATSPDVFDARKPGRVLRRLVGVEDVPSKRRSLTGLDSYLYVDADGNGTQLSGGQWQRLAIARTLLHARRTGIALFDEPTSALDPFAEADLLGHIVDSLHGQTLVLVTHRLSHVARADHVVVVEKGVVSASGTPAEVYAQSEWYREAFDLQAAGYSRD